MILLKKISESENPLYKAGDKDQYKYGRINSKVSVPVDYEVEGELITPIEEGKSIRIQRSKRNGVSVDGVLITSAVTKIEGSRIYTQNSIYEIKELNDKRRNAPHCRANNK